MDADLPFFLLKVFKFKGEGPEAAALCGTYEFIVAVVLFTGQILDPLPVGRYKITDFTGTRCARRVRGNLYAGIFFAFIEKADFVLCQVVRSVFDLDFLCLFRNSEIQISNGSPVP